MTQHRQAVLVIEDDELSRMVFLEMVEMAGYEVAGAGTGQEGLEWDARGHFGIIMLDNLLPDGTGAEVLEQLRAQEATLGLPVRPVIAVTGDAAAEDRERFLVSGFTDYLSKPVSLTALHDMLAKYLPLSGS
ncbi:MAG: response regulator [Betaproteobacteria bacterium]|nr:response regulator [Betaproteobacteria bacterium]